MYEAVYRRMLDRARTVLGLELRVKPPLLVESSGSIRGLPGLPEGHVDLAGLYVRDEEGKATIHVISHLTEDRLAAVLAHELAHAWQAEHCPEDQSLRVREGFAEWVAWHLVGTERERDVIAGRTDVYGDGFRLFARLEAQGGIAFAIWWATVATSGNGEG